MRPVPDLDDLVANVRRRAQSGDPLDRLAEAVRIGNELGARSDALVDHFVTEARDAGLSWAQIGGCLGVSKQAAQQQFVDTFPAPRMSERKGRADLERYTKRARQTVKAAVRSAQGMGCSFVGTEHLLLGMLSLEEGVGPDVLTAIKPLEDWRGAVAAAVTVTPRRVRGRIPFTPLARNVMAQATTEAIRLGHNYVGTEHQLLALASVAEGLAARILADGGADYERIKADVVARLAGILASGPRSRPPRTRPNPKPSRPSPSDYLETQIVTT